MVWNRTFKRYQNTAAHESIVYNEALPLSECSRRPITVFLKCDCVDAAISYIREGHRPLLLNMASWHNPGGGVTGGASAQEEDCFRRSNYFRHLHSKYYPLGRYTTILSPHVEYYCHGRDHDYAPYTNGSVCIDMIASAAPLNPPQKDGEFLNDTDVDIIRQRLRIMFSVAKQNGNDVIILSAWGCGAYNCPYPAMARLMWEATERWGGLFHRIIYAIIPPSYEPFKAEYDKCGT